MKLRSRRLIGLAIGIGMMIATGVAAIVYSAVTGDGFAGAPPPSFGPAPIRLPGQGSTPGGASPGAARRSTASDGCPLTDRPSAVSRRPGSIRRLVPNGATSLLVCRYQGLNPPPSGADFQLVGAGHATNTQTATSIATQLNALRPAIGAYSCPADDDNMVVAYFRYQSGVEDPVSVGLRGCRSITNGHIHRLGLGAPVVSTIERLARPVRTRVATISGRVRLCGGIAPGRCRTSAYSVCSPKCVSASSVRAFTAGGIYLGQGRLRRGRFRLNVAAPGRYTLKLMAVNRVLARTRGIARLGHTTHVVFTIPVK